MNLNADFYFFSEGCSKAWNFYRGQGHEKVAIVGMILESQKSTENFWR